jgi:hypothetical protein
MVFDDDIPRMKECPMPQKSPTGEEREREREKEKAITSIVFNPVVPKSGVFCKQACEPVTDPPRARIRISLRRLLKPRTLR